MAQILMAMEEALCDRLVLVLLPGRAFGRLASAKAPVPIKSRCQWLPVTRLTRNPNASVAAYIPQAFQKGFARDTSDRGRIESRL